MEVAMRTKGRWIYVVGYKPPGIKDLAFYDIFSTLCDLILLECQTIVIFGDYICDFMVDTPERYMWKFWFTKSHIWSDLFKKKQDGS